jgi:hypothetical protein
MMNKLFSFIYFIQLFARVFILVYAYLLSTTGSRLPVSLVASRSKIWIPYICRSRSACLFLSSSGLGFTAGDLWVFCLGICSFRGQLSLNEEWVGFTLRLYPVPWVSLISLMSRGWLCSFLSGIGIWAILGQAIQFGWLRCWQFREIWAEMWATPTF